MVSVQQRRRKLVVVGWVWPELSSLWSPNEEVTFVFTLKASKIVGIIFFIT